MRRKWTYGKGKCAGKGYVQKEDARHIDQGNSTEKRHVEKGIVQKNTCRTGRCTKIESREVIKEKDRCRKQRCAGK